METQFSLYVLLFSIFWTCVAIGAYISASRTHIYHLGKPFFILRGVCTKETIASEDAWNQAHQGISRVFKRGAILCATLTFISLLSILGVVSSIILLVSTVLCVIALGVDAAMFRKAAIRRAAAVNDDNI